MRTPLPPRKPVCLAAGTLAGLMLLLIPSELGIEELLCFTLTTNRGSQRVMEKAGFRYLRHITHATLPHVLYLQSATQWQSRAMADPGSSDRSR